MKTFIDPKLAGYIIPSEIRNNSKSEGKIFTPGTRIAIPEEAKFLRLFTAWGGKTASDSCDIDLSGAFIKTVDGKMKMEPISFYSQSANYAVHSGDFTSCKMFIPGEDALITAEYIDINIERAKNEGFDYILTTEFIFSRADSYDKDFNVYSGVILLDELRAADKQMININNSLFKIKLEGEFKSHCACAIDLKTREIVVIDQYAEASSGMTIGSMVNKMDLFKRQYFEATKFKENMFDFMTLYCEANDIEVVDTIEAANRIVSYDDYQIEGKEMFNVSNNLESIISLLN